MPGRTGPRTAEGKRRSSLNALKHGLRADRILPCRKEACRYFSDCAAPETELWKDVQYGDPCLYERLFADRWRNDDLNDGTFNKDKPEDVEDLDRHILHTVLKNRAVRAVSLLDEESARFQANGPTIPGELAASVRKTDYYLQRHENRLFRTHLRMGPWFRGILSVLAYKRECHLAFERAFTEEEKRKILGPFEHDLEREKAERQLPEWWTLSRRLRDLTGSELRAYGLRSDRFEQGAETDSTAKDKRRRRA